MLIFGLKQTGSFSHFRTWGFPKNRQFLDTNTWAVPRISINLGFMMPVLTPARVASSLGGIFFWTNMYSWVQEWRFITQLPTCQLAGCHWTYKQIIFRLFFSDMANPPKGWKTSHKVVFKVSKFPKNDFAFSIFFVTFFPYKKNNGKMLKKKLSRFEIQQKCCRISTLPSRETKGQATGSMATVRIATLLVTDWRLINVNVFQRRCFFPLKRKLRIWRGMCILRYDLIRNALYWIATLVCVCLVGVKICSFWILTPTPHQVPTPYQGPLNITSTMHTLVSSESKPYKGIHKKSRCMNSIEPNLQTIHLNYVYIYIHLDPPRGAKWMPLINPLRFKHHPLGGCWYIIIHIYIL